MSIHHSWYVNYRRIRILHSPDPLRRLGRARADRLRPALPEEPGHGGLVRQTEATRVSVVSQLQRHLVDINIFCL